MTARLVVLASGSGSTLQAVLDAAVGRRLPGRGGRRRHRPARLPGHAPRRGGRACRPSRCRWPTIPTEPAWDAALAEAIGKHQPDLVVLAGFMRLLAAETVNRFPMVNTHPSLLPSFPGAHAVADALAHGVKVSGVTVHRVDAGLDSGPILAQAAVRGARRRHRRQPAQPDPGRRETAVRRDHPATVPLAVDLSHRQEVAVR